MKKSLRIGLLAGGLVIVALILALAKNKPEQPILFYSNYCPHCQNVEKYINENNIKEKYSFTELEVADNQDNAVILAQKAAKCGIDTDNIGVPLLFDNGACFLGDIDITTYLSSKK